jgi:hypothetical protein
MRKALLTVAATTLAATVLGGCAGGNTYQPNASDTQLSAYAGQASYPYDAHSELAVNLFCTVAPDATITLYNAADHPYTGFEVWVNKSYTLHVEKLDSKSNVALPPAKIFNKSGSNLAGVPASSIASVQIYADGKLLDVQGPIMPH